MNPDDQSPSHPPNQSENQPPYVAPQQPAAPSSEQPPAPQVVHMTRPINPEAPFISEALMRQHQESQQKYPTLNLSKGEYVLSAVRRHPIGLVPVFAITGLLIIALLAVIPWYASFRDNGANPDTLPSVAAISALSFISMAITALGGFIAVYVYVNNKFSLTNESVIQEIQTSLFARHEQTVSLANIEDASYTQNGIIQQLFNYGSIRLSTEGDETTYRFTYVANPKKEIATLNNAVEAFKNGRPVTPEED